MERVHSIPKGLWVVVLLVFGVFVGTPTRVYAAVDRQHVVDLVWGTGGKGPYTLSRRNLIPGTEQVSLRTGRLLRGIDYQVNEASGTVTFDSPLPSGTTARVEYDIDAAQSGVNLRPTSTPMALDLAQLQLGSSVAGTFQFNGMWRNSAQGQPEMLALGVGADTLIGSGTRLKSTFAMTPRTARTDKSASDLDATGLQISGETNMGGLHTRASFLRAGNNFVAAPEYKWSKGTQVIDLATDYKLDRFLTARSSLQRTELLAAPGVAPRTTTALAHQVSASLGSSFQVQLGHRSVEVESEDTALEHSVTNSFQLNQRLARDTSATVQHQIVTTGQGEDEQTAVTTGVKLDARMAQGTRLTAEHVEARVEDQDASVRSQVGLTSVLPGGGMRFEGRFSAVEGPGVTPEEVMAARVEATPLGGLKLIGGVEQKQTGTDMLVMKDAAVDLKTFAGLQVVGRFNTQEDATGKPVSIVRSLDANMKPFKGLEFGGLYKEREAMEQGGPFTRGLRLKLAPARFFELNGSVTENPEENGLVRAEEHRTAGVRSSLGSFTLTGDYRQRLTLEAQPLAEDVELGLAIQLSRYDRFFSRYRVSEEGEGPAMLQSTLYRVGYARSVGSVFGLSLEGEYLQYMQGSQFLNDRSEARAKAGITARF